MSQYTLASNFSPPGTVDKDDDESDSDDEESSKPQLYDNSNHFGAAHTIDEEDEGGEDVIEAKRPETNEAKPEVKEGGYLLVDE